ncbi:hypothetical protein Golob_027990, partial [Gossypium lobatum]|nr:hypothetical protein [Gossypium lobatum]
MDKMDAHEKKYRLSSTSVWQRECQVSTRLFIVSILNFKVVDFMIKPSIQMTMN